MIWIQSFSLKQLNNLSSDTLMQRLDIEFIEIGDNYLKASMPVDSRTYQPLGLLHGGASCALVETVAGAAANLCIDLSSNMAVGLELNANHIKSVASGQVTAITKPAHIGKRTHVWHVDIHNELHELICVARHTVAIIDKRL